MAGGAPGGGAELGASTVLDAAREGNADLLTIALARGGDASATSDDGTHTALGITALRGHTDCTRLLLSAQGAAGPHRHSSPAVFTYDVTSESR